MGDDETCSSFHQVIHCFLDQHFCSCIYGAGRLIEDQDLRICEDRAGDRQKLFLTLRYVARLFVELHIIAARKCLHEAVYMGRFSRLYHFFICGIQFSVPDVLHDRAMEEPCVLKHHAEHFSELAPVEVPDVVSVDLDRSAVHIIETHEQLDHGRLSGSCRTDNGNLLSLFYFSGEIVDDDLIRVIAEMYVIELNISL